MTPEYIYPDREGRFRITGGKDDGGNWVAECTCGYASLAGLDDFNAMRNWAKRHAARHTLKAVSR